MSNGKGDTSRPFSVTYDTYLSNWERTFNKEKWEKPTVTKVENEHSSETDRKDSER